MLFSRLKLKSKLFLLIGLSTFGFLALIYFAIYSINQTKIGSEQYLLLRSRQNMLEQIARLQNNLSEIRVLTASMVSVEDTLELERIKTKIRTISVNTARDFNTAIKLIKRLKGEDDLALTLSAAEATWTKFYKTILETEYVPDIFSGDNPSGLKLVIDTTQELQNKFTEQINAVSKMIHADIEDIEKGAQEFVSKIILFFVASSALLSLAVIVLGVFIANLITRPLRLLTAAAKTIAAGNLNQRVEVTSADEVGQLAFAFNEMIYGRRRAEEGLKYNYRIQSIINELLKISLADAPINEILERILDRIIGIPWLELERRGGIFLMQEDSRTLVLVAQKNLSPQVQQMCANVALDRCLCGKAALSGEIICAEPGDPRHENKYDRAPAHGHYCIPVISEGKKVLGVINLYLKESHEATTQQKELLYPIANILAGIIERKQTEEALRLAYTKLRETQDQLIEAEKFKAIGQIASGVAHEVKNPLAIILQSINYLENRLSQQKDAAELLDIVKHNIERADGIVAALMDISKVTKLTPEETTINAIVLNSLALIPHTLTRESVKITKELTESLPPVLLDRKKMEQVFINILLNSIQAMPRGGDLRIRTYLTNFASAQPDVIRKGGNYFQQNEVMVVAEIEDTGCGISQENLQKIFDPFFTTKGPRQGTGLGLSVIKNIIEMHKGFIEVKSQQDKGTKITIGLKINREGEGGNG